MAARLTSAQDTNNPATLAKVSFYLDKEVIKFLIKDMRKRAKYGVADNFHGIRNNMCP